MTETEREEVKKTEAEKEEVKKNWGKKIDGLRNTLFKKNKINDEVKDEVNEFNLAVYSLISREKENWNYEKVQVDIFKKSVFLSKTSSFNLDKKIELKTICWKEFYFFDIPWRIEKDQANIQFEFKWQIYKLNIDYKISLNGDVNDDNEHKEVHKKDIKIKWKIKVLKWWKFEESLFNENNIIDIIFTILNDYKYNKYLEIKRN